MKPTIKIISWNVTGLNCQDKRGSVKWVLRRFSCDFGVLLGSKLEVVNRYIILSL